MWAATVLLLGVAAASSLAWSSTSARETAGSPKHGNFAGKIKIGGGRTLYLQCAGRGRPTVILESGVHDSSDVWKLSDAKPPVVGSPTVFRGVARFTHVCIYDRPGTIRYTNPPALTTRSSPVPMPRTLQSMAADLHALLHKAGVPGPYLLAAHSYGGLIVRYYAQKYPREAAGMVLVDALGTNIKRLFGRDWPRYEHLLNFPGTPLENEPGWETVDATGAIKAINNAKLPRMPLAVISKTKQFSTAPGTPKDLASKLEEVWPKVQSALVNLEPATPHIFATGSDHYVQINDPDLTISTIKLILDRARHSR
ncbi:MAG: alpha/beta hydrolase [Solirubrobacterales bacterium]|nr:alpha/beta hydrolase [Solirubrobacterales bacterium]MBV8942113.1 alpha/beta hydrolase [Solirubrobacterales bacterium]MBV9167465.1 alpha/beta hydrolase [Solirubrobacterales bacterium]